MKSNSNIFTRPLRISQMSILSIAVLMQMLFFANNVSAQSENVRPAIVPIQMGTLVISQGKSMVKLNESVMNELKNHSSGSDYYVVLTSTGKSNISTTVTEKGAEFFNVQASPANGNDFEGAKIDYIIFINRADPEGSRLRN